MSNTTIMVNLTVKDVFDIVNKLNNFTFDMNEEIAFLINENEASLKISSPSGDELYAEMHLKEIKEKVYVSWPFEEDDQNE